MNNRNGVIAVGSVPLVLYYCWVFRYAVSIPQLDDFHAIFSSVEWIRQASGIEEKLKRLLALHNEHRIGYTRLMAWISSSWSNGPISLKYLIIWGNLALILLLFVLYRSFRSTQLPQYYFVPVPFLLFQLQYFENTFFAMAALQNLGVWAWAAGGLWLLVIPNPPAKLKGKSNVRFAGGLILSLLASYTSGNGVLVWPMGALVLIVQQRWRHLVIWTFVMGWMFTQYFDELNFENQQKHNNLIGLLEAGFGFIGSFVGVSTFNNSIIPAVLGGVITIWIIVYAWKSFYKVKTTDFVTAVQRWWGSPPAFWLVFFGMILLTATAISLHRDPALVMSVPRYKIASILAVILAYLITLSGFGNVRMQRVFVGIAIVGSIGFCLMTYLRYTPIIEYQRNALLKDGEDFRKTGTLHNPIYKGQSWPQQEWKKAIDAGLYRWD